MYKVTIIGAGSIGALKKDHIDYPDSANILTHANAVSRHPKTELTAIIDTDSKQLLKAKAKWNPETTVNSYNDLIMAMGRAPDIIIVSVPTDLHGDIFGDIFSSGQYPKLIIAEKPFGLNLYQSNAITELATKHNVPIAVDYIRRYANEYKNVKRHIDSGRFGKALNCRVLYTRGLRHEGVHGLDLMRYFFGKVWHSKLVSGLACVDRDKNDPTLPVSFIFEKCDNVVFQPCDGRKYGIFEVDICFENCRLRFIDNGLYIERYPINEENEWGHKSLDYSLSNVLRTETGLNMALYGLIDNAVNFLDGKEDLLCTSEDAIAVHQILEELR